MTMTTKQNQRKYGLRWLISGIIALPVSFAIPYLFFRVTYTLCPKSFVGGCDLGYQTFVWFGMHIFTVLWVMGALVAIGIGIYKLVNIKRSTRKKA